MAVVANAKLTLKVVEAQAKDVGRAIARLDPKDMERLGLEVGEVIQIEGKRKTVAKVMPAYPEDRGKSTIQIDGLIRENAKASLDEKVTVTEATARPAEKIILAPLQETSHGRRGSHPGHLIWDAELRVLSGQRASQKRSRGHPPKHHDPAPDG